MLHVRVVSPADRSEQVVSRLESDDTVANLVWLPGVARQCGPEGGDLVMFDLARENANPVLDDLRAMDLERDGSIAFDEAETVMSQAADRAEKAAPADRRTASSGTRSSPRSPARPGCPGRSSPS